MLASRLEAEPDEALPIIVDLDGTLTPSDTLVENFLIVAFHQPLAAASLVAKVLGPRERFKADVAAAAELSADSLPYRQDLVSWLEDEHASGREIHLVAAADQSIADAVAARFPFIDSAFGSRTGLNLKSEVKARYLAERFPQGFVYVGDGRHDLPVWKAAGGAVLVGGATKLAAEVEAGQTPVLRTFENPPLSLRKRLSLFRVHQWSKNVMIFVPLVLSHSLNQPWMVAKAFAAFLCFSLVASATYVLNDLADLGADRLHATKRNRVMASGAVKPHVGAIAGLLAFAVGLVGCSLLSLKFTVVVLLYVLLTVAYSFRLKSIPLLDIAIVGALFTMRVVMGIVLLNLTMSIWILSFSMLFFFSLATAKRHAELVRLGSSGGKSVARRGYEAGDVPLTLALGITTAIGSVIITLLYIQFEAVQGGLYVRTAGLFFVPLCIMLWTFRVWFLSHRGVLNDDPVVFALRDKVSWGLLAAIGVATLSAL